MKLTAALLLAATGFAVANAQYGCDGSRVGCCVNNYRAKYGLKPLGTDPRLCKAALLHSQAMAGANDLQHNSANGQTPGDRMRAQGVQCGGWAENIASGQPTEDAVCAAWIASPGHRRNIVGNYDAVCTARSGSYWTQDFAKYSGGDQSSPIRCNGAAPVSQHPSSYQQPTTSYQQPQQSHPSVTLTYRKVLYRQLLYSNGHYFYKYYYKLVPVYIRSYHDASGNYTAPADVAPDSYDLADVQDVSADYTPQGQYETTTVPYSKCAHSTHH